MNQKVNIGIAESERKEMAHALCKLLASTYTLTLKTQNYHWNVTGMEFYPLHKFFEEQYDQLAEANDEIAERIRTLGEWVPATFADFQKLSEIKDNKPAPTAKAMLESLLIDHETIIKSIRSLYPLTEKGNDEGTADFITTRLEFHEKSAWMIRAHFAE